MAPVRAEDVHRSAGASPNGSGRLLGRRPRREFEKRWAQWLGARNAVCCSSGTAALHVSLLALGVAGGEVIVPSHTFASTVLAILHAGADPVFCDVCDDGTLDPRGIKPLITPGTRAIIAVHLYGTVCAMDRIGEIARQAGLSVVEDCAQCVGGEAERQESGNAGSCRLFQLLPGEARVRGGRRDGGL